MHVVRHWWPYLWGRAFVVRTDHYALKFMLDQQVSMIPQHQWISKLFGFYFRVEYRLGRFNTVVDALSRHDGDDLLLSALSMPSFKLFDELHQEITTFDDLRARRDAIAAGDHDNSWRVLDGLIIHNG